MKYVKASILTYDASEGRIEPGETYWVEDDKAERWINAGIAVKGSKPPDPEPEPEPEGDEDPADDEGASEHDDSDELAAQAHKLHDEGASERAIAQELGISRPRVHALLQR